MLSECWWLQSYLRTFYNCIFLLYWSHDQYFSNKNENGLASYVSLTVASKWHKQHPHMPRTSGTVRLPMALEDVVKIVYLAVTVPLDHQY